VRLRARTRAHGAPTLGVALARRGKQPLISGGVAFAIARGKRVVARTTVPLSGAQLTSSQATVSWSAPKLPAGSYRVFAVAIAAAEGPGSVATSDERSARVALRVR
jgi:hypothetical protein